MQLPGGLSTEGQPRDFAFLPVTGHLERAVAEAAGSEDSLPQRVTRALCAVLKRLGGQTPDAAVVAGLAVGDRQFLMRRLAVHLGVAQTWLTARCARCGVEFDFFLDHGALPVKEAGAGFPFARAETSRGNVRLRVPTGADQDLIARLDDAQQAQEVLVSRCLVSNEEDRDACGSVRSFSAEDLAAMESALEEVAPEVATLVLAVCSECGRENRVEVDPYFVLRHSEVDIDAQVHVLASTYHWSETEILGLSRQRRLRYLALIDRARGIAT